ncbi:ABC transporter substrate-binding protein [Halalkalibacter flavus]|uniref:ABC transporter substrate-binding protein n=1 Tax=Halalkalibacter flavus TaxID=3090668 RepID=UPI002FC9DE09
MMKNRLNVIVLLAFMFVLAACSNSENTSQNAEAPTLNENESTTEESTNDGELTIAIPSDIASFDIHDHNQIHTEAVHINIFSYLLKRQTNMEIEPDLLENYEAVDDVTWSMTLKEGVTFHNGDPLTSEDVKFTLERVATDETLQEHSNLKVIKEVNVLNDYEFEIITDGAQPTLLNLLSRIGSGILPKNYIDEHGWDHFLNEPIGTGPLKFVEWVRDDRIVLEPYEDYFEGKIQNADQVVFRVIPETSTRINELLTGGVDIITDITPDDMERINAQEGVSAVSAPSQRVGFLGIHHGQDHPTTDPKVREAIELAIDSEAITQQILLGEGTPTRTRITPGNFGAHPNLFNSNLYDIEKSKQLLAEAGYADGLELTLTSPDHQYLKSNEINEVIAAMLGQVGIQVNLQFEEWSRFLELRNNGEYGDMYFAAYGNSIFDSSIGLQEFATETAWDRANYANDEIVELWDAALTNMNFEEREQQYQRIQEIVAEERPKIYLYLQNEVYGVNDHVIYTPRTDSMLVIKDMVIQ